MSDFEIRSRNPTQKEFDAWNQFPKYSTERNDAFDEWYAFSYPVINLLMNGIELPQRFHNPRPNATLRILLAHEANFYEVDHIDRMIDDRPRLPLIYDTDIEDVRTVLERLEAAQRVVPIWSIMGSVTGRLRAYSFEEPDMSGETFTLRIGGRKRVFESSKVSLIKNWRLSRKFYRRALVQFA